LIENYDVTVKSLSLYDLQNAGQLYRKVTADWDQNQYVAYAAQISNNDLDFLSTLDAENGLWTHDKVGITADVGFCQFAPQWHPDVVNDPRFKTDPYWQLDQCWKHYKEGTRFYGYDNREAHKDYFVLASIK